MDVLHCRLINIKGRVYRVEGTGVAFGGAIGTELDQIVLDEEDVAACVRDPMNDDFDTEQNDPTIFKEGDFFVAHASADSELFGHVIGQKGRTKQQIETETGCKISVPRIGDKEADKITVRGTTQGAVRRAKQRVEMLLENAVNTRFYDYTHFVSIPLVSEDIRQKMVSFKTAVLGDAEASAAGIEDSIFVSENQLHLTVVMLKLYSNDKRQQAMQVLKQCRSLVHRILQGAPLAVNLKGLEYMNDDPTEMNVLFLGVHEIEVGGLSGRLQRLCDAVRDRFAEAGLLMPQDERTVKLHATLMNTRYRKAAASQDNQQQQRRFTERVPFNGLAVLEKFGDLDFGQQDIKELHVSRRGKFNEVGYYQPLEKLKL